MSQKSLRSAPRMGTRPRVGMPNPATVYAEEQGLTVVSRTDAQGNQSGVIILPNGQEVNQWDYYRENYVRPTTPTRPPKAIIAKKMNLRPGDIILRQSSQPSRRIGGTPTMAERKVIALKKINFNKSESPQLTKLKEKVVDIKKIMREEKRSLFFS